MASLQFSIDNICANFTVESISDLVKSTLAAGPGTISDIARAVADGDRSLDIKSAQTLAEAAVEALVVSGDLAVHGSYISSTGSVRSAP